MGKKGTGGWVRRERRGNSTTTYNSVKGTTRSYSMGTKGNRITSTILPDGRMKRTTTITMGGMTKRETQTWGGTKRQKKFRFRKGKSLSFSELFYTILFFFIILVLFSK